MIGAAVVVIGVAVVDGAAVVVVGPAVIVRAAVVVVGACVACTNLTVKIQANAKLLVHAVL